MPKFGARSKAAMAGVHPHLLKALNEAIKTTDFTVICGPRGAAAQAAAFKAGASKAKFGQSPHNYLPALAIDFIPSPFTGWSDTKAFKAVADAIVAAGKRVGVDLEAGYTFRSIKDWPHVQLRGWKALRGTTMAP
jgi:peptidoglycan LD-endopeptidase CwlK